MKHIIRIVKFSWNLWPYYVAISIFTIVISLLGLLQPLLSGWAIDEIRNGTNADMQRLLWFAFGIFIMDFSSTIINNVNGYYGDQMSAKLQKLLSERYYQHLMNLPQQYFDTELSGTIVNRLNRSILQITQFMKMFSNNFLQFVFSTVFSLLAVAFYSWQVALLLFILYPIYIYMTVHTSTVWLKYQATKNLHLDIASGRFAESIGQIKAVKSFIQERRELAFFTKHMKTVVDTEAPQSKFWHQRDIKRRSLLNVIFLIVYSFIFIQAANGHFSPGTAVAIILLAMNIRMPIFTISFLVENTQRAVADSKDYFEIMSLEPAIADAPAAKDITISAGEIVFEEVEFQYDKGKPVLKGLTFTIAADSKVALVGESGEGKTTITNLLMRLYEPQSGAIYIDGQDIASVTQQSLRKQIGVVFQDPSLFSGTIYENIAYANIKATKEAVIAAAKAANAHEFIEKFEKQYETEIGERGLKLSGGQKQRIAIARALLKDAPILVLDEATSSLDSKSEAMVQEALERLMKGRTTIIVAHRLSTIQNVDKIVTLRNGKVDEIGTPAALARSGGIYDQLLRLQAHKNEDAGQSLKKYDIQA